MKESQEIYLDNAAATPMRKEVLEAMLPYLKEEYGNPGSLHDKGQNAKRALDQAREIIAKFLNCKSKELIFTSGGTESNNLAILGYCRANKEKGNHIITSKAEHLSVLEPFQQLEKEGFEVTYLDVNEYGQVEYENLKKAIRKGSDEKNDSIFCSLIHGNNEIGTLNPIKDLGALCRKYEVIFHTDAAQTASLCDLDVIKLHVDMMTINGSKIYGPKGASALYVKTGLEVAPLFYGGSQEKQIRPGTENVAAIVGLAKALELAQTEKEEEAERLTKLRDQLIAGILANVEGAMLNGHPTERLPFNVSVSIPKVEAEAVVIYLNESDIYLSTGSACTSSHLAASHVIEALNIPKDLREGTLRFSLGRETKEEDIDKVIKLLPEVIRMLRI